MPALVHFKCQGGGEQPLKIYLRRITESKVVEIPAELLNPITDASHEAIGRRDIMRHLRECLSESTGKRWHRIYAALLLVEKLMVRGAHALVVELAHGHHFDLIQKVSLLEHFDSVARGVSNPWAQDMVRRKACELRGTLVPLLKAAAEEELPTDSLLVMKEPMAIALCSPALSSSTLSTAASSAATSSSTTSGSPALLFKTKRRKDVGSSVVESPDAFVAYPPSERLQLELSRITESGVVDLPPEFFTYVVRASSDPESQLAIMTHMKGCLRELSKCRWQRIYACLCLVGTLIEKGAPHLFVEAGGGTSKSSDNLVRLIWHLQEFEYRQDWRAQNLVRKKARQCHDALVSRNVGGVRGLELGKTSPGSSDPGINAAFSSLRDWVESVDLGAPSEASSRPSSDLSEDDPVGELPFNGGRTISADSTFEEAQEVHDGGHGSDTFFTPMQTPALAKAVVRPSHLLSL